MVFRVEFDVQFPKKKYWHRQTNIFFLRVFCMTSQIPPALQPVQNFIQIADTCERIDPITAYYCLFHLTCSLKSFKHTLVRKYLFDYVNKHNLQADKAVYNYLLTLVNKQDTVCVRVFVISFFLFPEAEWTNLR